MSSAFKYKGCGPQSLGSPVKLAPMLGMIAKKVIVDKVAEKASSATPLKVSCWKGCEPKTGTPKTKKSPTRPGIRVNNCDCG